MSKKIFLSFVVLTIFTFILSSKNTSTKVKAVATPPICEFPQVICDDSPDDCYTICNDESDSPTPTPKFTNVTITPRATIVPRATEAPTSTPTPSAEGLCSIGGGSWNEFGSSCADSCAYAADPGLMCLTVMTDGCDCGPKECWNGNNCETNPSSIKPTIIPTSTPANPKPTITTHPTVTPVDPTPTGPPQDCSLRPACLDFPIPCLPPIPAGGWCQSADFDLDGDVDQDDYDFMSKRFFNTSDDDLTADLNNDGRVDLKDYSILVIQWHNLD